MSLHVIDNPELLASIKRIIEEKEDGGQKRPFDFNRVAKEACSDCFGQDYTPQNLDDATAFAIRLCGRYPRSL